MHGILSGYKITRELDLTGIFSCMKTLVAILCTALFIVGNYQKTQLNKHFSWTKTPVAILCTALWISTKLKSKQYFYRDKNACGDFMHDSLL